MRKNTKRILIDSIKSGVICCIVFSILYFVLMDEYHLLSLALTVLVIAIFVISGLFLVSFLKQKMK